MRIRRINPVNVREQEEVVGVHERGHVRAERVVISKLCVLYRHCVVFVHYRDDVLRQ